MTNLLHLVRAEKRISDRIKSEWLGAEARVEVPLRRLDENRVRLWSRRSPTGSRILLFVSGLAIGGCFVLFDRIRGKSRQRFDGGGPCPDLLAT